MPLYNYRNCITGEVEEHFRTIAERDMVPGHLKREFVMPRMQIQTGAPDPDDSDHAAPRALKEIEEKHGADYVARETGYSTKQLKEIWGS
ncbi:MAG: hypothetical protein AAFX93_14150 [Verrucomicrobiota bacterium]